MTLSINFRCIAFAIFFISLHSQVQASVPQWITEPTPDSEMFLYSVGSSNSLEGAKQAALVELAGKINSRVQQLYQSKERAVNNQYTVWTAVDTQIEIGETDLRYFYVNKTEQIDNVYWVQLILDKTKMAEELATRIELENETLQTQMLAFEQRSAFEQFLLARSANTAIASLKQRLLQQQFYQSDYNIDAYISQYSQYLTMIEQAVAANKVYLDDDADPAISAVVRNWLAKQGINLVARRGEDIDIILLRTNVEAFQDKRNAYNAEITTSLKVLTTTNKQIGYVTLATKGRDYKRAEQALSKAANALALRLKHQEAASFLNIELSH